MNNIVKDCKIIEHLKMFKLFGGSEINTFPNNLDINVGEYFEYSFEKFNPSLNYAIEAKLHNLLSNGETEKKDVNWLSINGNIIHGTPEHGDEGNIYVNLLEDSLVKQSFVLHVKTEKLKVTETKKIKINLISSDNTLFEYKKVVDGFEYKQVVGSNIHRILTNTDSNYENDSFSGLVEKNYNLNDKNFNELHQYASSLANKVTPIWNVLKLPDGHNVILLCKNSNASGYFKEESGVESGFLNKHEDELFSHMKEIEFVNVVDMDHEVFGKFVDEVKAIDINTIHDKEDTTFLSLEKSSDLDKNVIGSYVISYTATNVLGYSASASRTVTVVDTVKPGIVLKGLLSIQHDLGKTFIEPGYRAIDNYDKDITHKVKVSLYVLNVDDSVVLNDYDELDDSTLFSNPLTLDDSTTLVDSMIQLDSVTFDSVLYNENFNYIEYLTNNVGSYVIKYHVMDSSNNYKDQFRVVHVSDVTAPEIKLIGDNPIKLSYGDNYVDPGVEITDNNINEDSLALNNSLNIEYFDEENNLVDLSFLESNLGKYVVKYTVSDSSGNISSVERVVENVDDKPPVIEFSGLHGDSIIYHSLGDVFVDVGVSVSDNYDQGEMTIHRILIKKVDYDDSLVLLDSTILADSLALPTTVYGNMYANGFENIIACDSTILNDSLSFILEDSITLNSFGEVLKEKPIIEDFLSQSSRDTLGEFYILYFAYDSFGNVQLPVHPSLGGVNNFHYYKTIHVVDTEAPVITLYNSIKEIYLGEDIDFVEHVVGSNFIIEDNVNTVDELKENLEYEIFSEDNVLIDNDKFDTKQLGRYTIKYTAVDDAGNKSAPIDLVLNIVSNLRVSYGNFGNQALSSTQLQGINWNGTDKSSVISFGYDENNNANYSLLINPSSLQLDAKEEVYQVINIPDSGSDAYFGKEITINGQFKSLSESNRIFLSVTFFINNTSDDTYTFSVDNINDLAGSWVRNTSLSNASWNNVDIVTRIPLNTTSIKVTVGVEKLNANDNQPVYVDNLEISLSNYTDTPAEDNFVVGGLTVEGLAQEGGVLEIIGDPVDVDHLEDFGDVINVTFQWQKLTDSKWEDISGETNRKYQVPHEQSIVGSILRCEIVVIDFYGGETKLYTSDLVVANTDDEAIGNVEIVHVGTKMVPGTTLGLLVSNLVDLDGFNDSVVLDSMILHDSLIHEDSLVLDGGVFKFFTNLSFQWQINDGSGYVDIDGATERTYVVKESDLGKAIKCILTTTDELGGESEFSSVVNLLDPELEIPEDTLLLRLSDGNVLYNFTKNISAISFDVDGVSYLGDSMALDSLALDSLALDSMALNAPELNDELSNFKLDYEGNKVVIYPDPEANQLPLIRAGKGILMNLKVDNDRTIGLSSILCSDANGDSVSVSEYVIPIYKLRITGDTVGQLGITNVNVYDSEGNEVVLSDPSASSTAEGYSAEDALDGNLYNESNTSVFTYGLTGWLSEAESSASYWEAEFLKPISKVVIHYLDNQYATTIVGNFKVEILDGNNNDAQLNNLGDTLGGQKTDGSVYINGFLTGIYKETIDEIVMNLP